MRFFVRRSATLLVAVLACVFTVAGVRLEAQTAGTVSGRVTEAGSQRALGGVQVSVPGTERRAVTNAAGEYTLAGVPAGPTRVRASLIGYGNSERTITIAAGQTARADFQLSASATSLDAIVVTGTPGATQKRTLGNAITTVPAADITEKAPVRNVTELLQARSPGLTILPGAGTAGTAASIRIRGAGSLSAGNQPVFYIDGVRINAGGQSGFSVSGQSTSALDAINPEDIESIEVIKGPAAATLYGADAANGVIQIITKKGRAGQQSIQWNAKAEVGQADWALDHPTNYTLCDAAKISRATQWPGCQGVPVNTLLSDNPLQRDPTALRSGDLRSYTLSARGGGERYSYYLSGDREEEEGVFYNNFANRTTGRANFGVDLVENLNLAVNIGYTRSDTRLPLNDNASNGLLRNAYRGQPGSNSPFEEGYRGLGPEATNSYSNVTQAERWVLGATVTYEPRSWFRNRLTAGLDSNDRLNTVFYPIDVSGRQPFGAINATGAIYQFAPETHNWTFDYAGTITNTLPRNIASDFSFGMQLNAYRFESLQANGEGLTTSGTRLVSSAAVTRGFEGFSEQNSLGFFVQEQLGFADRLFVTGAVRVDDNSAFGQDFTTVVYPKAQVAYVISEEPFFNFPAFDQLKLRAAYGKAGNAPNPFSAEQNFAPTTVTLNDGTSVSAITASAFGNPDLKAETGREIELGFDAAMFGGRAGVEATYYNKRMQDALLSVPVPPSSGFSGSRLTNAGETANSGFELALFGTPISGRALNWDTRVAASWNRNELVSFGGTRDTPIQFGAFATVQRHQEGFPLAGYWGQDVIRDAAGNPVLTARGGVTLDTAQYIGSSVPTREISLANTVTLFRNLQLYGFLDYKGGHYMWNAISYIRNRNDLNAFEVNNPAADPVDVAIRRSGATVPFIQKADFVKLRELSVAYTVPGGFTQRLGVERASVSLAGRNLAIWTDYEGSDPELNFSGNADFTRSDYASVPMIRRIVASVNFSF